MASNTAVLALALLTTTSLAVPFDIPFWSNPDQGSGHLDNRPPGPPRGNSYGPPPGLPPHGPPQGSPPGPPQGYPPGAERPDGPGHSISFVGSWSVADPTSLPVSDSTTLLSQTTSTVSGPPTESAATSVAATSLPFSTVTGITPSLAAINITTSVSQPTSTGIVLSTGQSGFITLPRTASTASHPYFEPITFVGTWNVQRPTHYPYATSTGYPYTTGTGFAYPTGSGLPFPPAGLPFYGPPGGLVPPPDYAPIGKRFEGPRRHHGGAQQQWQPYDPHHGPWGSDEHHGHGEGHGHPHGPPYGFELPAPTAGGVAPTGSAFPTGAFPTGVFSTGGFAAPTGRLEWAGQEGGYGPPQWDGFGGHHGFGPRE